MNNNKRFVLDTNLIISGILTRHSPPSKVFDYIRTYGEFIFSEETFKEVARVLYRPKFDRYISIQSRDKLIHDLIEISTFVSPQKKYSICRDVKDNMFLDIAVEGEVSFIISGDEDLLVLEEFAGIPIVNARTLLNIIGNW